MGPRGGGEVPIDRLTTFDLMFLRLESVAWPCHFGGLVVVDGATLLDEHGTLRLDATLAWVERRVARVRRLRQRVHEPGPLRGRPIWVDDSGFDVRAHVHTVEVDPPGGEVELLDTAARVNGQLLERGRPLWELWFLTGLQDGRVGVLLKLHHSVADGLAAVTVMSSLFDVEPEPAALTTDPADVDHQPQDPAPVLVPSGRALFADHAAHTVAGIRTATAALARPARVIQRIRRLARTTRGYLASSGAPASSLNQPVRKGRRVRQLVLDLAEVKAAAHARQGKVNDVVLTLWAGGIHRLLAARNEATDGVELVAAVPVSLRLGERADTMGNQTGTMVLPLPVGELDPEHRLASIVATTGAVKANQHPAAVAGFLAGLAATPLGRAYVTHQRANNVVITNVTGPPVPVYLAAARVEQVLPIIQLIGNVGLTLCAMSYAGQIHLVVTADAQAFPDIDVLVTGMSEEWVALHGPTSAVPLS